MSDTAVSMVYTSVAMIHATSGEIVAVVTEVDLFIGTVGNHVAAADCDGIRRDIATRVGSVTLDLGTASVVIRPRQLGLTPVPVGM